ncbi:MULTISPECIES: hypothetical protein [Acinetobacter]|jgi:hypothetical protein|uniref:Uncharacterized protein n=1 Tax=Acinetobacter wuhouensis TaxID=1879050 RepID=A0A4Q7AIW6_9GAMM|nr:hypothetical protein [Acinetobacter wuhouensis]RZG42732.1 hypothetical protein EXU28_18710 [Acinetobacter wuhouensis]
MTNLNFNGGNPLTRRIPAVGTSHGCVLYALCRYGRQTAQELIYRTGYLGAQERTNELLNDFYLPIQKGDLLVQMPGRETYVKTYGLNWDLISTEYFQDFMDQAENYYGDLPINYH